MARGMRAEGTLTLQVLTGSDAAPSSNVDFHLEVPGVEGYVIGRSDSSSSYKPDVDLEPFGAQQKGLSRRHAALVRYRGLIHLLDLGSMNGTFVNGKRLPAQVAYALNSGDQISLANLHLLIYHIP